MDSIYAAFETDNDLLANGLKVELVVSGKVYGSITIRPADAELNPEYKKAALEMGHKIDKYMRENDTTVLPPEVDRRFMAELYYEAVVTAWEMAGKDGAPMSLNKTNLVNTFVDLPVLFNIIKRRATMWTNFRKDYEEDQVKD